MKLIILFISIIYLNGFPIQPGCPKKSADKKVKKEVVADLFPKNLFTHFN